MPKKKPPTKRTLQNKLDSFGMSYQAVTMIEGLTTYLRPAQAVRMMANYLLAAESREEVRWRSEGIPQIEQHFGLKVVVDRSKAYSFKLPGGVYTPDFFYILEDGQRVHVEVKGSKRQPNYRDARSKIRIAATLYWWDVFCEVRWENREWTVERILPDTDYATELQEFMDFIRNEMTEQ